LRFIFVLFFGCVLFAFWHIVSVMRIEIDSSKPDDLRKLRREHEFALQMIDAALSAIGKESIDPKQPSLPQIPEDSPSAPKKEGSSILDSGSDIAHLVDRVPVEFTSSDLFAAAEIENIPRSQVRRGLAELVEGEWLVLVEAGKGRRPSRFRKT
jgi:hypothetical protein